MKTDILSYHVNSTRRILISDRPDNLCFHKLEFSFI